MKTIQYSMTFLGTIEVPDDYGFEEIRDEIIRDYEDQGLDGYNANDIEWEEV